MERHRTQILAFLAIVFAFSSNCAAQESWSNKIDIALQGTGFFTKDSSGNGITQHANNAGGPLINARYHFTRWLAAEGSYGYTRNTQQNSTPAGAFNVQTNVFEATGAAVVTLTHAIGRVTPYFLAGAGSLTFDPTGNAGEFVPGAQRQRKAAFLYGGGVDYGLNRHFALRLEYRGFVYGRPDFGIASLKSNTSTHSAQPSAGIVFRF